ncbi:MAG: F0F1 ATP synthase subunit A [Bacteriovoracaceae bacterium]|nr:F0F1 ATP synthase subunit A [Bacteriovoracaceae bacterium]
MKMLLGLLSLVFLLPSNASASGYTFLSHVAHDLHVPEHVITFGVLAVLITIFGFIYRLKVTNFDKSLVPDKGITFRNIVEAFGEFMFNLAKSTMGEKEAHKYFPVLAMIFLFIFLSNLTGLVPGFLPPTDNINTTLALGIFVFIYYNYQGIREMGIIGHLKHFAGPVWYLAPLVFVIEIISHAVRPVSLALRLRGNMFGDHLVLSIFSNLLPYIVPIVFMVLGLFVCFIQAFVFTLLTMVYISLATAHHDHDEAGAHH